MLFSKDDKCRVEANNRITWILKTSLNRNIKIPNDVFVIEIDEVNEKVDQPIGEYSVCNLYIYVFLFYIINKVLCLT